VNDPTTDRRERCDRRIGDRRRKTWRQRLGDGLPLVTALVGIMLAGWAFQQADHAQDALAEEVRDRNRINLERDDEAAMRAFIACRDRTNLETRPAARITAVVLRDLVVAVNEGTPGGLPEAFTSAPAKLNRVLALLAPVDCQSIYAQGFRVARARGLAP